MIDALAEAWLINNRVNLNLIKELTSEGLAASLSSRGGRTVGQQLVHVHEVRRAKVELADKALGASLILIDREQGGDQKLLLRGFKSSGDAVADLIRQSKDGKVKGFKRGIVALVGYFIAHDAHHRGHILLTLKQCKIPRSSEIQMGLWAWNAI